MTEWKWLYCDDPKLMLVLLEGKASDRKFRLWAVACWREVSHLFTDKQHREAVEIGEQFADGLVSDTTRQAFWEVLDRRRELAVLEGDFERAVRERHTQSPLFKEVHKILFLPETYFTFPQSWVPCALIRDIFGNPFRPIAIDPSWLTWHDGTIPRMVKAVYDERAFDHLPILADALEEAGCQDQDILGHCRQPGVHTRGCWVADLLLGKS